MLSQRVQSRACHLSVRLDTHRAAFTGAKSLVRGKRSPDAQLRMRFGVPRAYRLV
jgi:hypothetical protein